MGIFDHFRRLFGIEAPAEDDSAFEVVERGPGPSEHFKRYIAAYERAEKLRKDGRGTEARPLYELAIAEVEADPWNIAERSVPPAPYTALAKMLYHMGDDAAALAALDRYTEFNGREDGAEFREKIASGKMRRLRDKYR